jgi:hypothetical protein
MAIREFDPWRAQYFDGVQCPPGVEIPTDDADAWVLFPEYRHVYDKLFVALSQGMAAAPWGVPPPAFPVFAKPIMNLKGMGAGSRVVRSAGDYEREFTPGAFWMPLLEGDHVSSDAAVVDGQARWWRHATGLPAADGMFRWWTVHAASFPEIEDYCGAWIARMMPGYTGLLNFETIAARIIEVHLRFADQWPDLYGAGWVEAAVRLYAQRQWVFADNGRRDGFSIPLFARHGAAYRHPPSEAVAAVRAMPGVSSVQITFHEGKPPSAHAMPPGGFRLAIVNATDLGAGIAARDALARCYPPRTILDTGQLADVPA